MLLLTLFVNQFQRGWTYTFYKDGDTPPTELPGDDKAAIMGLASMANDNTIFQWARYSVVGKPQYTRGFVLTGVTESQWAGADSEATSPDVVSTDAQFYIYGENSTKRFMAFRGMDDGAVERDQNKGVPRPSGTFFSAYNAAIKKIAKAEWKIKRAKTPERDTLTAKSVSTIKRTVGNPASTDVTFLGDLGARPAESRTLSLRGRYDKKLLPYFPKNPRILLAATSEGITTVTIPYTMPSADTVFATGLTGYYSQFAYEKITTWQFLRFGSRDTGRPFGSSRGRKQAATARL